MKIGRRSTGMGKIKGTIVRFVKSDELFEHCKATGDKGIFVYLSLKPILYKWEKCGYHRGTSNTCNSIVKVLPKCSKGKIMGIQHEMRAKYKLRVRQGDRARRQQRDQR